MIQLNYSSFSLRVIIIFSQKYLYFLADSAEIAEIFALSALYRPLATLKMASSRMSSTLKFTKMPSFLFNSLQ